MKSDKNVIDMTNDEISESYNLFAIKPPIRYESELIKGAIPLFVYEKCSILKDDGVQYSNCVCISQEER